LKLSTRARYGTRALLDLALHLEDRPVQLKDIASRQNISLHYLEHIIAPLVSSGIVKSTRGVGGGIELTRQPHELKLSEVVRLLEGKIASVECIGNPECCNRSDKCVTRDLWNEMQQAIDEKLGSITLQDLVERQNRKGQSVQKNNTYQSDRPL
jgi:Rrf2 family cysteine metabolism transcriptional repressor